MRDKLVGYYHEYAFEKWFISHTSKLSVNWHHESPNCLLSTGGGGVEELGISPIFDRHIMRLETWSLGSAFARPHPELEDTCRIKNDEFDVMPLQQS